MDASTTPTSAPSVALSPVDDSNYLSDAVMLKELLRDGLTVGEAGQRLNISRSTAFRRLALLQEDIDRGVANLLVAKGLDFAENWIKAAQVAADKGDHRPAKDALLHARAIEPVVDGSNQGGARIAIIIGTPEQPIRVAAPQPVVVEPL